MSEEHRRPKEIEPNITDVIKNPEYWNKRTLSYIGDKIYFDQEIRTGVCYLCKRDGRLQKSSTTYLHHLKYDHDDKLAWTIEVCGKCHWQIDEKNRDVIARRTGKEIPRRYGKYDRPYYENKEQRKEKAEQEERGWYKRFCSNLGGKFVPLPQFIPTQELYDDIVKAIKEDKDPFNEKKRLPKKKFGKSETMSDVSRRYL